MARRYHIRRAELSIKSRKSIIDLVMRQSTMTIAMCRKGEPYLVTVDYAFDKKNHCLYFHCSRAGKKLDFLKANPRVWGQIVEDLGYVKGECEHSYRTVMFGGKAEIVSDIDEKRSALGLMIDKIEDKPGEAKKRLIKEESLKRVSVVRIKVLELSGKESIH